MADLSTDPALSTPTAIAFERGGFWRRVVALLIDLAIATLLLQVLAFALYPATGGRVQFPGGFMLLYCDHLDAMPEGFQLPADFVPTAISDCRQGLFDLTSARVLRATQVTKNGALVETKQIAFLRDAEGKQAPNPILGELWLPLFFVLRLLLDIRRGTPGRRLFGIKLLDAASGQSPPPRAVARRYLLQALPIVPYVVLPLLLDLPGLRVEPFGIAWWIAMIVPALCAVVAVLIALHRIIHRREAFYDRSAQTAVLRIGAAVRSAEPATPSAAAPDDGERAVADAPDLAPAPLVAPLAASPPQQGNYLMRHWRGQLPLPIAYWVNGVVLGFLAGAAIGLLGYAINRRGAEQPVLWLVSLIATWVMIALFAMWQSFGVWRAASQYDAAGKTFWGGAAKISVVFGVLNLAYNCLFVAAPQLAGITEILSGDARVGPHQFRVLSNGQALEFSGGITFGVAREFENFLNAMGNLKTVRLNSIGGRMLEAQKMADMIKARGLTTYVKDDCLSACTVVFLGGKDRVLRKDGGKLGFHQTSFRGMTAADRRDTIALEIARLESFGLSRAFAERATSASPEGMWYPDQDELLREKVVTRLFTPQPPKPAGTGAPAASTAPQAPAATSSPPTAAPPAWAPPPAAAGDHVFPTPPSQSGSGTDQPGRAQIPADTAKWPNPAEATKAGAAK